MIRSPRNLLFSLGLWACLLSPIAQGAPEISPKFIDLDFFKNDVPLVEADPGQKSKGLVTGRIPGGWRDDSAWAKATVDYQLLNEEGRNFLAMKALKEGEGWAQLYCPLPNYSDGSDFQLTFKARATAGLSTQLGIRMVGAPYQFVWSQKLKLQSGWQVYQYDFTIDKIAQPTGFWIAPRGVGELDIAELRLEKISHADMVAKYQKRYPDGGPKNLLRNSRLPLGLQSGLMTENHWTRFYDSILPDGDPTVEPVSDQVGISGFPPLRVAAKDTETVISEPFSVPIPATPYTASLYVRGTGSGVLRVTENIKKSHKVAFKATEDWTRVELPFEPKNVTSVFAMSLAVTGDMQVDAWQVSPGSKALPYQSQELVEVALACPAKDTGEARLQFIDEPAKLKYYISGNPYKADSAKGSSKLCAKVVNLYGEEAQIKPISLAKKNVNQGEFSFDILKGRPLGPFRVETWVEDAKGTRISAYQEMVVYRLQRPRYWGKDAPDSPFGGHINPDPLHLKMAKSLGINWARIHDSGMKWIGWYYLERTQGQWTFFDDVINRYRSQNIKILGYLATAPAWASCMEKPQQAYFDQWYQPKDLNQYANYVRTVVEHYKGVIDAYDVWNEPWNAAWFARGFDESKIVPGDTFKRAGYHSGEHPQAEYAAIMKAANDAAKSVAPEVRILGLNTTTTETNMKPYPDTGGADWSKGMKALNSEKDCDIFSYHQYDSTFKGFPGDAVEKGLKVAVGPFVDAGVKKPVWLTEGNSVMGLNSSGFYNRTLPYTDTEDVMETGNRACRFALSLLANGVSKMFFYTMGIYDSFGAPFTAQWPSWIAEDGYLHPSAAAFSQLTWKLEDTKFHSIVPIGLKSYVYLFTAKGRTIAVIAPAQHSVKITLPKKADWTVTDMLGNPQKDGTLTSSNLVYIETAQPLPDFEKEIAKLSAAPR